jgi:L-ascorbate metabolism protein UlaG (beta-lactamase superfamily)
MKNPISDKILSLTFLGGAGFLLRAGETEVLIDPYLGCDARDGFERMIPAPYQAKELEGADYLFSSHGHLDHCDPEFIAQLTAKSACELVGPQSSIEKMRRAGIRDERLRQVKPGDELDLPGCRFKARRLHDPMEPKAIGLEINMAGVSLLHGGDAHYSQDYQDIAESLHPDVALLSCGQEIYMSAMEMLTAARDLGCGLLIPMHWDLWRAYHIPPHEIEDAWHSGFDQRFDLAILQPGQTLSILKQENGLKHEFKK